VGDDSIWKKEISFGRKNKPALEPELEGEAAASAPFWKKEIGLSRKAQRDDAPAEERKPATTPFWKKEISLSRKAQDAAPAEPADSTPIWKKEISFGRKKESTVAQLAEQAVQAVAPAGEQVVAPQAILPELPREPVVPQPEPVAAPEPAAEVPAPEEPTEEVFYEAPQAVAAEPVAAAPADPEPAEPEPWEAPPALPPEPAPAPAPAPVVVHPPVPAAELPPLADVKVPFWKKEIGGKKKQPKTQREPAAPPEAKAPFWKKELGSKKKQPKPVAAEQPTAVLAPKVPFWKKEIGGKKKQKQPTAAPVAAETKAPSVPFWKRGASLQMPSLSLARKPKGGASGGGNKQAKAKKLVGLKIGASQIAAARITNNGVAELMQIARQPLEQGLVVGGELRDPDALADQLKLFFARNKLPKKNVRLGIASNRIGVRIFDVDGVQDEKQLTNAIHFRAQEALPIPLDEAVLDYHVLSETVKDDGEPTRRILLVVAYRELVERYIAACRKAGISLLGIDLEAFALLRAIAAPREEDVAANAALVAVSVGHERSTFAVSDGRVCEFTRVLEWGGASLNVALARALDLAPSEVEAIKRALTLEPAAEPPDGLTPEQWSASIDAVRKQLQSFARELVSSLQFYQNQPGSLGIGEIVLTGGTAHLPGLADELQKLIGVRVRVADPLARLKVSKKVATPEQIGSLAVAIGLGIED
jgi:type IV pilus assembly protein PilM